MFLISLLINFMHPYLIKLLITFYIIGVNKKHKIYRACRCCFISVQMDAVILAFLLWKINGLFGMRLYCGE